MNTPSIVTFAGACGLVGPLELGVSAERSEERTCTFTEPWIVVGRDGRSSLSLGDDTVSRRHAYLQVVGGRLLAIDLNSRTGISVAGARTLACWLDPGQTLSVGPFQLEPSAWPALDPSADWATTSDPLDHPQPGDVPMASFDILLGCKRVARWRMNRLVALVGSSARCRVRLRDASVSRIHCSLVGTPKGVWVVDLCSRSGTWLRDETIRSARLEEGDVVEVGPYRLRLKYRRVATSAAPVVVARGEDRGLAVQSAAMGEPNALFPLVQQFNNLQQQMFDQFQQTLVMLVRLMSSMHQEQVALIREELGQIQKVTEELNRLQGQAHQGRAVSPGGVLRRGGASPVGQVQPRSSVTPLPVPASFAGQPRSVNGNDGDIHDWVTRRVSELQADRQSRWQRIVDFVRGS
jgi:pSer/pThr/pTyr-binding forkhead associated (FHA) protein